MIHRIANLGDGNNIRGMNLSSVVSDLIKSNSECIVLNRGQEIRPMPGLYYIENGFIKITLSQLSQSYSIGVEGPNRIINQTEPRSGMSYTYEAIQNSKIFYINENRLPVILAINPELALIIFRSINKTIGQRDHQICIMQQRSAQSRIVSTLIYLNNTFNRNNSQENAVGIPLDKRTLAELSGTVIETLSRNLTKLEKNGTIKRVKTNIMVEKPEELQQLIEP